MASGRWGGKGEMAGCEVGYRAMGEGCRWKIRKQRENIGGEVSVKRGEEVTG